MTDALRIYWDANVVLNYLNEHDPGRVQTLDGLLYRARKGEIEIVTSTLTVVEVAFITGEFDSADLPGDVDQRIAAMWFPPGPVKLVDLHLRIAEEARALVRLARSRGQRLTPRDAVHLASAVFLQANAVHTYDKPLHKFGADIGIEVTEPTGEATQMPLSPT